MFTSFDENKFRQAILDKNYMHLKVNAVSAISYDPTFERGEANDVIEILKKEVPEIFEEYKQEEYEERLDRNEWDKRYFSKLTYWFQENFAEERLAHIKEVGKAVYPAYKTSSSAVANPEAANKQSVNAYKTKTTGYENKQEKRTSTSNPQRASEKQFPVAGALLTAGALVLAGILLYKILSN